MNFNLDPGRRLSAGPRPARATTTAAGGLGLGLVLVGLGLVAAPRVLARLFR